MKKRLLSLILGLALAAPAYASIAVAPTRIELNANKVKNNYITTVVEVRGSSKEPIRFKAYPSFFKISEKSDVILLEKTNDPHDLSKKLRFVPSEFNVAAGKTQKVRINVSNINSLPDGESRAMLYIEDINPAQYSIPTGMNGIGAQVILKTRVGVPIYIDKNATKIGDIESLQFVTENNSNYAVMKVVSTGNSRIRYKGKIQILDGKKLLSETNVDEVAVGGENFYVDKCQLDLSKVPAGEHTMRAVISYNDQNGKIKNVKKEIVIKVEGKI